MTNNRLVAKALVDYMETCKGVGNTTVMVEGVKSNPNTIVVGSNGTWLHGNADVYGFRGHKRLTLANISDGYLRSIHDKPIAIDHHALCMVLSGLLKDMSDLEQEIDKRKG